MGFRGTDPPAVKNPHITFGAPKTQLQLTLGIHRGLFPGPLRIPKFMDAQVPYGI